MSLLYCICSSLFINITQPNLCTIKGNRVYTHSDIYIYIYKCICIYIRQSRVHVYLFLYHSALTHKVRNLTLTLTQFNLFKIKLVKVREQPVSHVSVQSIIWPPTSKLSFWFTAASSQNAVPVRLAWIRQLLSSGQVFKLHSAGDERIWVSAVVRLKEAEAAVSPVEQWRKMLALMSMPVMHNSR